MSLLPPGDELELIHTRNYETRVYRSSDEELLVRGVVSDTKPPGLYVAGDPDPLEMHQMQLELRVSLPELTITDARVLFESHPHASCPLIADDYRKLVGLSISRGFSRSIRNLLGGPRGCTHVNALLQAMAPAVVQATWSLSVLNSRANDRPIGARDADTREKRIAANLNTCHIWSEEGDHVKELRSGDHPRTPPLPVRRRLSALGRNEDEWE